MTVSSAIRWPLTRPVLARTSSAASGFFFCGMIEEPVENESDSLTKPNCGVDQMTISSASRDRCVAADRGDRQEFQREIAVGHAVERVARRLAEAERLGRHVAVDRKAGAGQRCRTERRFVHALDRVADARKVAAEHLDIGHAVMAEGDRLRRLQVGEARHDGRRHALRRESGRRRSAPSTPRRREAAHPSPRGGNRPRPGRCASGRCAGAPPRGRSVRPAAPRHSCGCLRARSRTRRRRSRSLAESCSARERFSLDRRPK